MSMSCESPSKYPMSFCEHGVNYGLNQCVFCKMQHSITLLESHVKALTEMYKEISCIAAGLQDHKIRQIDENRKISKIVYELEDLNKRQIEWNSYVIEEMKKSDKKIEGLQKRINDVIGLFTKGDLKLENEIDELENKCEWLINRYDQKKHHKCPVCCGFGSNEINEKTYDGPRLYYLKEKP